MDEQITEDNYFGRLKWNDEAKEWRGILTIPPHGQVGLALPPEYPNSTEIRAHIRATVLVIEHDEQSFRERAAAELFAQGSHRIFWPEDQLFDRDVFAHEMHLGMIVFDTEFKDTALTLWYEYAEGLEHGIVVFLTWHGLYRYAQET